MWLIADLDRTIRSANFYTDRTPWRSRKTGAKLGLMTIAKETAPFDGHRDVVRAEWIDENDHMNMGYYVVVFDLATDVWLDHIGIDAEHKRRQSVTTFTLESHVNYLRELRRADPIRFSTLLLGFDEKRIHYVHEMWHAEEDYLAATNELMSLHVSQQSRRGAPMDPSIQRRLAKLLTIHAPSPRPAQVGRHISLNARPG